ncbi:MAG: hypothetical protein ACODAQ_02880 [Phycisphaeraceae bacterium]
MVRPHETKTGPSLLRVIRESGDAHLGQTLVRLARQAADEHRAQQDDQAASLRRLVERAKAQADERADGEGGAS